MVFKSILYWYQNIRIYAVFCPLRISVFYLSNTEILFSLIKCALSYRNMTLFKCVSFDCIIKVCFILQDCWAILCILYLTGMWHSSLVLCWPCWLCWLWLMRMCWLWSTCWPPWQLLVSTVQFCVNSFYDF